jgi:putative two-component system response regulator
VRILIVDDEEVSLEMLGFTLENDGHEVTSVHNAADALGKLAAGEHQLVISDWEMAGMNGIDLCRAVRARDMGRYIYFVLLTARDRSASMVEGLAAGADDFINKPFDPDELTARVRVAERIVGLETRDMTIFALAKLAESRDAETGQHLERVQTYCRLLADHLRQTGNRRGLREPDLRDQPAARHREGGDPGLRAAEAGAVER